MEPITRKEKILAGEDIQPITRLEHFLKEAVGGGGGGGGLPEYTSADKGKVLGLAETDGTVAPTWSQPSGGGNLVITIDENTGAFSKTWNEIKTAITNGIIPVVASVGGSGATLYIVGGVDVMTIIGTGSTYLVYPYGDEQNPIASADSADGYPVITQ